MIEIKVGLVSQERKTSMKDFLQQIEGALDANLYYVALFTALAIPDICGAIDSEDGIANREKYIDWFGRYVAPQYRNVLSGEDCYYFRCSILHQGSSQNPQSKYSRVLFVEPIPNRPVLHCNVINGALNIDVSFFCMDLIDAANRWLSEVQSEPHIAKNMEKFMRRYPDGLHPYIGGFPVIS